MALVLKIEATSITPEGDLLYVRDVSNWATESHDSLSLFLFARRVYSTTEFVELPTACSSNTVNGDWTVGVDADGRIEVTMYAYENMLSTDTIPAEGTIRHITDLQLLMEVIEGVWVEVTDVVHAIDEAPYVSNILNVSVLHRAFKYKNDVNLEYIALVKNDLAHGAKQNELYYKRSNLDYINALIIGAEYNFNLALYTIYYDILNNLDIIMATGKPS